MIFMLVKAQAWEQQKGKEPNGQHWKGHCVFSTSNTKYLWGFILYTADLLQSSLTQTLHPVLHLLRLLQVFPLRFRDLAHSHATSHRRRTHFSFSFSMISTWLQNPQETVFCSREVLPYQKESNLSQPISSYLLHQPTDLQLLFPLIHLLFLLGQLQFKLHLLLVLFLLLHCVHAGHLFLFLLLVSFLRSCWSKQWMAGRGCGVGGMWGKQAFYAKAFSFLFLYFFEANIISNLFAWCPCCLYAKFP